MVFTPTAQINVEVHQRTHLDPETHRLLMHFCLEDLVKGSWTVTDVEPGGTGPRLLTGEIIERDVNGLTLLGPNGREVRRQIQLLFTGRLYPPYELNEDGTRTPISGTEDKDAAKPD